MRQVWWHKLRCMWLCSLWNTCPASRRSREERSDARGKIWWKRKKMEANQEQNFIVSLQSPLCFCLCVFAQGPCCFPKLISQWGLGSVPNGSTLWARMHGLVCAPIFSCVLPTHVCSQVFMQNSHQGRGQNNMEAFNGSFKSFSKLELLKQECDE